MLTKVQKQEFDTLEKEIVKKENVLISKGYQPKTYVTNDQRTGHYSTITMTLWKPGNVPEWKSPKSENEKCPVVVRVTAARQYGIRYSWYKLELYRKYWEEIKDIE